MPMRLLALCFVSYLGSASPAQAYVDPNAAGLIFQILTPILAVLAAGMAFLRMWSTRWLGSIRSAVHGLSNRIAGDDAQSQASMPVLLRTLWGRLTTIAVLLVLIHSVLYVLAVFDGWLDYLTPWEAAMSVAWHLALAVVEGIVLGALGTMASWAVLAISPARRRGDVARIITDVALVGGALIAGLMILQIFLRWGAAVGFLEPSSATRRIIQVGFFAILAMLLIFRRSRRRTLQSLDAIFNGSITRRTVVTAGVGAAVATLLDAKLAAPSPAFSADAPARKDARNIVLITFDALGAQHMSLYGCPLPTTPHIEAFAKAGTTFTNFYSCSTYTTPSVAACLTGRYPSETLVYHVAGFLRGRAAERNVARVLRAAGYVTAASVGNPFAHPDHLGIGDDFLLLPAPPLRNHPLSNELVRVHDRTVFRYATLQEALLLEYLDRLSPTASEWPPALGFAQAKQLLEQIGTGRPFFLWIHILAPHWPFKPAAPYRHRFLPGDEMLRLRDTSFINVGNIGYTPDRQPLVDKQRLRYAEFVAECDGAFDDFIRSMEASGRLQDTAFIVSADHGESFTGGVFTHGGPVQLRQIVHIPLMIRLPDGKGRGRVTVAADQTSLAPTILDIAGLPQSPWMRSPSLLPLVNGAAGGEGYAFTQHLELNSIFAPVRRGTIGIIDGASQLVIDLESRKGILRPLGKADLPHADYSAENPALAAELKKRIYARFPNLSDAIG